MLWGGEAITSLKHLTDAPRQVGESWEISAVPGSETAVSEGSLRGMTLPRLIARYGAALVGYHIFARYGEQFPLLIKFISAAKDLSVQVHPDDDMAHRMGHPFGKTEMWYVVDAAPQSELILGFNHDFSAEAYTRSLSDGTFMQHVSRHPSRPGDVFSVPAGRVHSIGAGNLLIEVQQTSDDTFRIYDYDRIDANGHRRELHIDKACEALDYHALPDYKTHYTPVPDEPVTLLRDPHFTTRLFDLTRPVTIDYSALDSFVVFIAFEGSATLRYDGEVIALSAGESVLFPAVTRQVEILPSSPGFKALEASCPD